MKKKRPDGKHRKKNYHEGNFPNLKKDTPTKFQETYKITNI